MGTTPFYAWPYPDPGSTVDVPRDVKALADKLETIKTGLSIPNGPLTVGTNATVGGDATITGTAAIAGGTLRLGTVSSATVPYLLLDRLVSAIGTEWQILIDNNGDLRFVQTKSGVVQNNGLLLSSDGTASIYTSSVARPIPFAMASGATPALGGLAAGTGLATAVTLPTGRFTVPPIVMATPFHSSAYGCSSCSVLGATSVTLRIFNVTTGSMPSCQILWMAMQATPTVAASPLARMGDNAMATCHTDGCENAEVSIPVSLDEDGQRVSCGVCGQWIDDVTDL